MLMLLMQFEHPKKIHINAFSGIILQVFKLINIIFLHRKMAFEFGFQNFGDEEEDDDFAAQV